MSLTVMLRLTKPEFIIAIGTAKAATPAKAMIDCAEFYLKAKDFDCKNQIMEYHIIDMME